MLSVELVEPRIELARAGLAVEGIHDGLLRQGRHVQARGPGGLVEVLGKADVPAGGHTHRLHTHQRLLASSASTQFRCEGVTGRSYDEVMVSEELTADHWVSRGYQQNFADGDKRVAILDVASGRIVDAGRPIRSNFVEVGFTTFLEAGVPNDLLERAFASVERSVLNEVRLVGAARRGPDQRAAAANLFAVHLVRSPAFKAIHAHVHDNFRRTGVLDLAANPSLPGRFERDFGRPPSEGELLELVLDQHALMAADPLALAETMARQRALMAAKLNAFHMQVVELDPMLPGFVIGDTPVVHADTRTGRYGFRDRLALGDANLIVGPLTRRTAVCFTVRPQAPIVIRTRKLIDTVNAIVLRAAQTEVACHPDDARALRQLHSRLDRLPPSLLSTGGRS